MKCSGFLLSICFLIGFVNSGFAADHIRSAGESFKDCEDCPEMIVIPPGVFMMGYEGGIEGRYEGPPRRVKIDYSFSLGKMEITFLQYSQFVDDTGYQSGSECAIWNGETWFHTPGKDWRDPGYGRSPESNEPVSCVTWLDVKAYTKWLAERTGQPYRLPTEAEWEYAARAGTDGRYTWGDDPNGGCGVANIYDQSAFDETRAFEIVQCNDGFNSVSPVGSLRPNNFGLHDMTGNVWEWTEDCYVMPIPLFPRDGSAVISDTCDRHSVKGGAWSSSLFWQRPTFRGRDPKDRISHIFGFRVARDLRSE